MRVTTLLMAGLLLMGCSTPTTPARDPIGQKFPSVLGESLDGTEWRIPEDLAGGPAVLLVGYVQQAQFDIDRWLLGISQAETPVPFLELPTIQGLAPRMFKGRIDDGMRSGIPQEDWRGVVTLWSGDSRRVAEAIGNETPANGRVVLLDAGGRIAWFQDRGYSANLMLELDAAARTLLQSAAHHVDTRAVANGASTSRPTAN